jgi:lipoprotein NlpD
MFGYVKWRHYGGLAALLLLSACSTPQRPAPIKELTRHTPPKISTADTYQVKKGDTLYSIAFRAGMDFKALAKLNRIAEPYRIYPGQLLVISTATPPTLPLRGPQKTGVIANKNSSAASRSDSSESSAKVVAKVPQKSYVQAERNTESEKISDSATNRKISQWHWPVKGPILAKFSYQEHGNKGLDIGGARGTLITAAAAGQVVYAGNALRGYGNLVIIRHNDDFLSAYAHNERLLVQERMTVAAGQPIAEMGSSDAERVQLHFEIRFRGQSVDPLKYLK